MAAVASPKPQAVPKNSHCRKPQSRSFAVSASPSVYGRPPYETYVVGPAGLTWIAVCKRVSAGAVNIGEVGVEDAHLGAQLPFFGG